MGAAGITLIVVALFFGWEALRHFRAAGTASAASGTSSGGGASPSTGSGASGTFTALAATPTAPIPSASSGSGPTSQPAGAPNSGRTASVQDIQHIIDLSSQYGIDPNAVLALVGWESNNFDVTATGDNGNSFSLFQIYRVAHPDYACGYNARCNIDYWFANFGAKAKSLFDFYGGQGGYENNPSAFLQSWAPRVQSSDPWNPTIAATAIARAQGIRQRYGI